MRKAIRSADRYHIITVEALWRMDKRPDPSEMGWSNMMYQLHSYDKEKKTTKQDVYKRQYTRWSDSIFRVSFTFRINRAISSLNICTFRIRCV